MFESGLDQAKIKRQAEGHIFAKKFSEKKFRPAKDVSNLKELLENKLPSVFSEEFLSKHEKNGIS